MRLYIAGPMTGLPGRNYDAFNEAQKKLMMAMYETENPVDNVIADTEDYTEYLRLGITQLISCDGVAFLPGFGQSTGAMMELYIANILKMPIKSVDEWMIEAYRQKHPEGEDSSRIESNPICARCDHTRGHHELKIADKPFGYCVYVDDNYNDCDCTEFLES